MPVEKFIINQENIRLDKWLSEQMNTLSRSKISTMIKEGLIFSNQKTKLKGSDILSVGTEISVVIEEKSKAAPAPENIPIDVIYEDADLLIINKPIHLAVHPGVGNEEHTLVNALLHYTDGQLSSLNGEERPGIVHRLDKDTSGLMIVCKNNKMHEAMARMFKNHQIKKIYHALSWGQPKTNEGSIDAPIARHFGKRIEMAVQENGKQAYTEYRVLNRFSNRHNQPAACELEVQLFTGRTHQIRVHLAYINLPIIGDALYTKRKDKFLLPAQALFAQKLEFTRPFTEEKFSFQIEEPKHYLQLKEKLLQSDFE